ncbi:hypothetical protein [Salinibacillus xinjiangensis]|uniref:Uncharacterized protein n=1 Tax=Salinibacillus xinjiangensis TaxID=1229268 RepID=A0A6G1X580_9BACI|nr:hypothetical protein [Salinibacillus xinjiangensis]MRG86097.1 hypothetical protein [Salinibacillus xinjiangensis]
MAIGLLVLSFIILFLGFTTSIGTSNGLLLSLMLFIGGIILFVKRRLRNQ